MAAPSPLPSHALLLLFSFCLSVWPALCYSPVAGHAQLPSPPWRWSTLGCCALSRRLQGMPDLLHRVSSLLKSGMVEVHVLIPYSQVRGRHLGWGTMAVVAGSAS